MKIRTDYVTNSSSSSMCVITIEKKDGTKFNLFDEGGVSWCDDNWYLPEEELELVSDVNELVNLLWETCKGDFELDGEIDDFFDLKEMESIRKLDDIAAVSSCYEVVDWGDQLGYAANKCNNVIAFWLEKLLFRCAEITCDPEAAKIGFLDCFDIKMIPEEDLWDDFNWKLIQSVEEFESILQAMKAGDYDEELSKIGISLHHDHLPDRGELTTYFEENVSESLRLGGMDIIQMLDRFEFDKNREQ